MLRKDHGVPTASIADGVLCILCCLLDLSCSVRQVEGRDVEQAKELALARSPLLLAGLCLQASQRQLAIHTFDLHLPVLSIRGLTIRPFLQQHCAKMQRSGR